VRRLRRSRRALRKRYGCFAGCRPGASSTRCLPKMEEAKTVKAVHKDVGWLARTEPRAKDVELSEAFDKLTPEGKRYIILHERAHLKTGPDHNARFYEVLRKLADANGIDWKVAWELESFNCHSSH
jgi:Protein of unknown function DUF45